VQINPVAYDQIIGGKMDENGACEREGMGIADLRDAGKTGVKRRPMFAKTSKNNFSKIPKLPPAR
jgi:hypothetical protein